MIGARKNYANDLCDVSKFIGIRRTEVSSNEFRVNRGRCSCIYMAGYYILSVHLNWVDPHRSFNLFWMLGSEKRAPGQNNGFGEKLGKINCIAHSTQHTVNDPYFLDHNKIWAFARSFFLPIHHSFVVYFYASEMRTSYLRWCKWGHKSSFR